MNIFFDYQAFYIQKYGGISRYITNLYSGLNQQEGIKANIGLLYSDNFYVNNIISSSNYSWKQKIFKGRWNRTKRWNRRYTKLTDSFRNYDIFHPTYYDPYFIGLTKKPVVITVHDMIHEKFSEYFDDAAIITEQKKECLNRANAVIAISQSTYNDLIDVFGVDKSKISIIYHGIDIQKVVDTPSIPIDVHPHHDYVLFVGERWTYKNFINLVEAITPILNQNKELNLVCAGGRAFTENEQVLFSERGIKNQCYQYTVDDFELHNLYKNAICFVFPSLYEGFGLPILEAFAANCPVLLSNTSCFYEIGGDAALYFNPYDVSAISAQINAVLYNQSLRSQLIKAGQNQLNLFPFEKCLHETVETYKRLLP